MKEQKQLMTNRDIARMVSLKHGYYDPAAIEFRERARSEERKELLHEIGAVLLWLGGGFIWVWTMWPLGGE